MGIEGSGAVAGELGLVIPMRRSTPDGEPVEVEVSASETACAGRRGERVFVVMTPYRPDDPEARAAVERGDAVVVDRPTVFVVTIQARGPEAAAGSDAGLAASRFG